MLVVALNFADSDFTTPITYKEYILEKLSPVVGEKQENVLVVLPAYSALFLAYCFGDLGDVQNFTEAIRIFQTLPPSWHLAWLTLQQDLSAELRIWFVCGTTFTSTNGNLYHEAVFLTPQGTILGRQKQLTLSAAEKKLGFIQGEERQVFTTPMGKIGIMLGADAWHGETGQALSRQGAEIICYCGAMPKTTSCRQAEGMWQQVQQNKFFCVESQLFANIAGHQFQAKTQILAPCELTSDFSGILAQHTTDGRPVFATLNKLKFSPCS
ncbi:MAG: hypothetical protein GX197_06785 [Firmicutes bacterium]|nr:hypothetical protein [Bacillota bacterium]